MANLIGEGIFNKRRERSFLNGNEVGSAQEERETVFKSSNGSGKQMKVCSKNYHEITKHFILFITN